MPRPRPDGEPRPPASALFTGACRSGKSALAQAWCERYAGSKAYVATAAIRDAEMAARVSRHRTARGDDWITVELAVEQAESGSLAQVLRDPPVGLGAAPPGIPGVRAGSNPAAAAHRAVHRRLPQRQKRPGPGMVRTARRNEPDDKLRRRGL
jgi:hypothetical protein